MTFEDRAKRFLVTRAPVSLADLLLLASEFSEVAEEARREVEATCDGHGYLREQIAERDVALDKAVLRVAELEAALDWVALYVETYRRGDWQSDIRDRAREALRGEGEK